MATLEAPQFWGILFFGCLIMLGIDSAFSLAEVMVTFVKVNTRIITRALSLTH